MIHKFEYGDFSTWTINSRKTSVTIKKNGSPPFVLYGNFECKFRSPEYHPAWHLNDTLNSIGYDSILSQFENSILIGSDSEEHYPKYEALEDEFNFIVCNEASLEYLIKLVYGTLYDNLTNIETDFEIVSVSFKVIS